MFARIFLLLLNSSLFVPSSAIIALVPTALLNNDNRNNVAAGGGGFSDTLNTASNIGDFLDFTSDLMDGTIFGEDTSSQTYGDQAVYYGNQGTYGAQTAYGVQQPYGSPAVYGSQGYGQTPYYYMNPSSGTGYNYQVQGEIDPSANMGCEARFIDVHDGKRRFLCNCGDLGYSYQYYYCGRMQGQ